MQQNVLWLLKQLQLSLEQYEKIQMKELDLSPTQAILLHHLLLHKGQDIYSADLHQTLCISKSSVSSALKALQQKGYVTVQKNIWDDRKKQLILTDQADGAKEALCAHLLKQNQQLCRQIPAQRLQLLADDLEQMIRNLKQGTKQEASI